MAFLCASPAPVSATALQFSLDTFSLSGTAANLAFDFINGDGPSGNNTVVVSNFYTTGTLGNSVVVGGATGTLIPGPVTLTDTVYFNEFLQELTLGTTVSFTLNLLTQNGPGSPFSDSFSFFLLDSALSPLFATTDDPDPNVSGGTLFQVDITGTPGGDLQIFQAADSDVVVSWTVTPRVAVTVPLPSTVLLLGAGLLSGLAARRRVRRTPLAR